MEDEVRTSFFEQSLRLLVNKSNAEILLAISGALWPALRHEFGTDFNVTSVLSSLVSSPSKSEAALAVTERLNFRSH